jgi:GxxExxY protein
MNHSAQETQYEDEKDPLTHDVIGAAIEVHRILGPGLLESVYQECLQYELGLRGIEAYPQVELPIVYKELKVRDPFKMDLLIPNQLVIELKTVAEFHPIHEAQLLTYLRLSGIRRGLLLNFNVALLKDGIRRMVL